MRSGPGFSQGLFARGVVTGRHDFFRKWGEEVHMVRQIEEVGSSATRRCVAIPKPAGEGRQGWVAGCPSQ